VQINQGFPFYRIHILQSLPSGELRTGFHLRRFLEDLPGTDGHIAYGEPDTVTDLLTELETIRDQLIATGQIPLIHIEAHGHTNGLVLALGEFLPWLALKQILTEINILCRFNLLLVISACCGENLISMVRLSDRSPFWGCIGPRTELSAGKLLDGFQSFYQELITTPNLRTALASLNGGLPAEQKPFVLWPAEYFFLLVYRCYLLSECTDRRIVERIDRIIRNLSLTVADQSEARLELQERIEIDLHNHGRHFEKYRRDFLMIDLHPENEERFNRRLDRI
jgi:hypothetical protein